MFGRTNPLERRLTRRQKLVMAIAGSTVLLVLIGLGVWGAFAPDSYSQSGHGCVNVSAAGSTGGNIMHYCGDQATQFCRSSSVQGGSKLAVLSRRQCQIAGLLHN
ncbi:MAG: hypothetical protein JO016_03815 [Actinobacteria bacterium]|nr:hypothetical protein [Actinomycetota bacterium]